MSTGGSGWQCAICNQWVYPGSQHYCGGIPQVPGATPFGAGCRAPWTPLTPEMIRLIVREELERVGLKPTGDHNG